MIIGRYGCNMCLHIFHVTIADINKQKQDLFCVSVVMEMHYKTMIPRTSKKEWFKGIPKSFDTNSMCWHTKMAGYHLFTVLKQ